MKKKIDIEVPEFIRENSEYPAGIEGRIVELFSRKWKDIEDYIELDLSECDSINDLLKATNTKDSDSWLDVEKAVKFFVPRELMSLHKHTVEFGAGPSVTYFVTLFVTPAKRNVKPAARQFLMFELSEPDFILEDVWLLTEEIECELKITLDHTQAGLSRIWRDENGIVDDHSFDDDEIEEGDEAIIIDQNAEVGS